MAARVGTPNGLNLAYHQLAPAEQTTVRSHPDQETALILVSGDITVTADGIATQTLSRPDPFTAPAAGCHIPAANAPVVLTGGPAGAHVIEVRAPAEPKPFGTSLIRHAEPDQRGRDSWQRQVVTLLQPPQTSGLFLGETIAENGRWSTYPPHRHQRNDPPLESELQEVFAFRVRPDTGFGVMLTYDETVHDARTTLITDTGLAAVPYGFHTVAAAGGYDLYYLWAAYGTTDSTFALHTDPTHAWLLDT